MNATTSQTLATDGAVLTYDVRTPHDDGGHPPLLLAGSPMGAAGFESLAGWFDDRTVITYDPRGVERSTVDGSVETDHRAHADDLHHLVEAVAGGRQVDVFASSGGAVNALAWVERNPRSLGTLVAHEPPLPDLLPDAALIDRATREITETYHAKGWGHGMAAFLTFVAFRGPLTEAYFDVPDPDPAAFGLPAEDDGSRDDPLLGVGPEDVRPYIPDFDAIRAVRTRVILAAGVESRDQMPGRAAQSVAEALGVPLEVFPSHHGGFLGGEYGQHGDPAGFAAHLRELLG